MSTNNYCRVSRLAIKLIVFQSILGLISCYLTPQTILNVFGTGTFYSCSGDGGPVTSATGSPTGVSADNNGNIYISDTYCSSIRKINTNGIITSVAGTGTSGYSGDGGPATSAAISPNGVALDTSGNIFIADTSNYRIRKVTASTGIITTVAGTGTAGYNGDIKRVISEAL